MKISDREVLALALGLGKLLALEAACKGLQRAGIQDGAVVEAYFFAYSGYGTLHAMIIATYGLQGEIIKEDGTILMGARRN